jgi:hypothetical protein
MSKLQVTNKHENSVSVSLDDQLVVSVHLNSAGEVEVYVRDQLREVVLVRSSTVPRDKLGRVALDKLSAWLDDQGEK